MFNLSYLVSVIFSHVQASITTTRSTITSFVQGEGDGGWGYDVRLPGEGFKGRFFPLLFEKSLEQWRVLRSKMVLYFVTFEKKLFVLLYCTLGYYCSILSVSGD